MKKGILTVIMAAILSIFFAANSPSPTTLELLATPKMWTEQTSSKDSYDFLQFTKTQFTAGRMIENVPYGGATLYYLSDSEVTVFDSTKVGKVENGKFIVIWRDTETPEVYEIKSLTLEKLVLFYDSKGKNVPNMTTSTWHAKY